MNRWDVLIWGFVGMLVMFLCVFTGFFLYVLIKGEGEEDPRCNWLLDHSPDRLVFTCPGGLDKVFEIKEIVSIIRSGDSGIRFVNGKYHSIRGFVTVNDQPIGEVRNFNDMLIALNL